jgi:hypothetical protein
MRACDAVEDVVERADRAPEQGRTARQELPLDSVDVRPVRHDENRLTIESGQIAVEQTLDLARVCRARDETKGHRTIVEPPADGSRRRLGARPQSAENG